MVLSKYILNKKHDKTIFLSDFSLVEDVRKFHRTTLGGRMVDVAQNDDLEPETLLSARHAP